MGGIRCSDHPPIHGHRAQTPNSTELIPGSECAPEASYSTNSFSSEPRRLACPRAKATHHVVTPFHPPSPHPPSSLVAPSHPNSPNPTAPAAVVSRPDAERVAHPRSRRLPSVSDADAVQPESVAAAIDLAGGQRAGVAFEGAGGGGGGDGGEVDGGRERDRACEGGGELVACDLLEEVLEDFASPCIGEGKTAC